MEQDFSLCPNIWSLVFWNFDFASVDGLDDVVWVLVVDTAANGLGSTQNLLGNRGQSLTERLLSHGLGDLDDVLQLQVTAVLDVLVLLSVSRSCLLYTSRCV